MESVTESKQTVEKPAPLKILGFQDVQKAVPHRYPFLLVDKVEIWEEGKKAVGIKCVSGNEEFFQGHFPGHPIMPGVLILEALAQTACVLMLSKPEFQGKLAFFMGIDGAKFRQPVLPGQVLRLHVDVLRAGSRAGRVGGRAYVEDKLAAEAEFSFALVDK
ncbi:MAG: 3-hydroxyacyl-ACP dehydratase FabZ [Elusimicrobia bacterium]|nr:3-hydroxyacyl-ACP dehydratase FabZ [Elusimicrobiota bacterium]